MYVNHSKTLLYLKQICFYPCLSPRYDIYILIMSVNLKVTVGSPQKDATVYSSIQLSALINKENLKTALDQIKSKTGSDSVPSLLVEFPATLKEHINIEILPKELTYTQKEVASKVFISGKLGESEGFFKNIESSFKEVTNLNNNIEFKLEVTHLDQWVDRMRKGHPEVLVWFDGARLTGNINTDPKLIHVLREILSTVCPEFINSPIFAALGLLDLVELEIGFDSFQTLSKKVWEQFQKLPSTYAGDLKFQNALIESKEDFVVYLTLPELVCLKFRAPCAMLGCFLLQPTKV